MSFHVLTDEERKELADLIGVLAVFFTPAAHVATNVSIRIVTKAGKP